VFAQDVERRRVDDFGPLLFGAPAPTYVSDSLQTAAFGQVERDFGPAWTGLLALRYDRDEREQAISAAGTPFSRAEATFDAWQPKATLSWRPGEDALAYATYAEGFRTGGFNPAPGPTSVWEARFEPETTRSAELGAKATVDGVYLEGAAYVSRLSDYQSYTFLENNSVTLNVDAVSVSGLELAFDAPRGDWRFTGSGAVTRAEIEGYVAPDPLIPGSAARLLGADARRTCPSGSGRWGRSGCAGSCSANCGRGWT
jgi:iron complex outermembrane receptor protein